MTRQVWVEAGEVPIAIVNWKREWLWLYAFVQPQTGETYWWLLPYVNTELFNRVLQDFAQHFGVGKTKRVILPLDQAGWHITEKLQVPEGIHLLPMPPYSPRFFLDKAGQPSLEGSLRPTDSRVVQGCPALSGDFVTPELQPAERLWPLVNEPLVNQVFDRLSEVEELVYQRCCRLLQQQDLIRGLTFYDWWPEVNVA